MHRYRASSHDSICPETTHTLKRILPAALLIGLLVLLVSAQTRTAKKSGRGAAAQQSAERAIRNADAQLEQDLADNATTHSANLAPEFVLTRANGETVTREQYLSDIEKGVRKTESYSTDDVAVQVFGSVALISGRATLKSKFDGLDLSGQFRFTKVFVKRLGRWQCVSWHSSRIGGKMITTESGLKYIDLVEGTGESPKRGQMVTVHYTGTLEDGSKFDSSVDRCQPFVFQIGVGRVIKGWDEGVMSMKIGGKRKLIIPADLGYGARGTPGGPIPPNATLFFEVELLGIK
jgi:ketosteroid isomerase-like protein